MTWHVNREIAVLLGSGSRAVVLQVAHHKVAAAEIEHRRVRGEGSSGEVYSARDPHVLWVYATLVDSSILFANADRSNPRGRPVQPRQVPTF